MVAAEVPVDAAAKPPVSFREALQYWVRLGFINFGGPAGQIAMMHRDLVETRGWIAHDAFLRALNFCTLLPGPEAQQLATYIGWRLHGVLGGVVAGLWFILPSVFVMLGLSWLVAAQGDTAWVAGLLYGVQPVVVAIVAEAVLRIGRRTMHHRGLVAFAVGAFIGLALLKMPFPLVVLLAALLGTLLAQRWPQVFRPQRGGGGESQEQATANGGSNASHPSIARTLRVVALFVMLWVLPVGALGLWQGRESTHVQEALFFTSAAFVTFGGAYAVLSYIAEAAVNVYRWLDPGQMVQGLALAESTPGPLIMVTQYVGFLGGWNVHGGLSPLVSGVIGALTVTYVTFLPCFMFIFVGAPYIEALAGNRRLQAALVGVSAAVVGVILNLAVFFGRHVFFLDSGNLDAFAVVVAVAAFLVLWRWHWQIHTVVGLGVALGIASVIGRHYLGL